MLSRCIGDVSVSMQILRCLSVMTLQLVLLIYCCTQHLHTYAQIPHQLNVNTHNNFKVRKERERARQVCRHLLNLSLSLQYWLCRDEPIFRQEKSHVHFINSTCNTVSVTTTALLATLVRIMTIITSLQQAFLFHHRHHHYHLFYFILFLFFSLYHCTSTFIPPL